MIGRLRLVRRRLGGDVRGATLVEFGLVAFPFCLVLLAAVSFGWHGYVQYVVQGVVQKAARKATIGNVTGAQIDSFVNSQLAGFSKNATVTITKKAYSTFTDVTTPEKITSDTAPVGVYNVGDCYEDYNNNGRYDTDRGTDGLGGADDVIYYKVTMTFPSLIPMSGFLGLSNMETASSDTILKNQPYAAQSTASPPVRCN